MQIFENCLKRMGFHPMKLTSVNKSTTESPSTFAIDRSITRIMNLEYTLKIGAIMQVRNLKLRQRKRKSVEEQP